MSLDQAAALTTFFASAPQTKHVIVKVRISHSAMSQIWCLWREPYVGVMGGDVMTPCNMDIKMAGSPGHLDQKYDISIDTTDSSDTLRNELKRIPLDTDELILLELSEYLSDDLENAETYVSLQVEGIAYKKGTATLSAVSSRLNINGTGVVYSPRDFPMLRAFV